MLHCSRNRPRNPTVLMRILFKEKKPSFANVAVFGTSPLVVATHDMSVAVRHRAPIMMATLSCGDLLEGVASSD